MPIRQLTAFERANLACLTALEIDVALIQPTRTGLGKSTLDATIPVRNFLREKGLHLYEDQGLGAREHGQHLNAVLVDDAREISTTASLFRPKANGDPRIWFPLLPDFAEPNDILAITNYNHGLAVLNLTRTNVENVINLPIAGPLLDILKNSYLDATKVANELLYKLRELAERGAIPSVMSGRADTAVGRTLEHALGIPMNSSREPDYKGIELKSYRKAPHNSRENRKNLFTKVANWDLSKFKSSREILDNFGYQSNDELRLYCTVSTQNQNPQGLYFDVDDKMGWLSECSSDYSIGAFAVWTLQDLRKALAEKHNETFWVSANVTIADDGREYFQLYEVMHTRRPILSQFDILLQQGEITMDHLIKRDVNGQVSEKGPSFKINSASLELLFPPSIRHSLIKRRFV